MRTLLPRNSFNGGILGKSMSGRIDLPIYGSGLADCVNFNLNYNGSINKRKGFELVNVLFDDCYFRKFIFNNEQSYILEFMEKEIGFWTYVNGVMSPLVFALDSPYSLADAAELQFAQNFDAMYICHRNYLPKKLVRTSADTFTLSDVVVATGTGRQNPFALDGNPSCCAFYESRLYYAGFVNAPNKLWGSDTGYYDVFTTNRANTDDIEDIDGFHFQLANLTRPFLWLRASVESLAGGSGDGIITINGNGETVTPFNINCRLVNGDGAAAIQPIMVNSRVCYVDNLRRRLKSFVFDRDSNSYLSVDLNLYCYELTINKFKRIEFKNDDYNNIYCLMEDGSILVNNYLVSQELNSWSKLEAECDIKDIITIPRADGFDDLFLHVFSKKTNQRILLRLTDEVDIGERDSFKSPESYVFYVNERIRNFNFLDESFKISYEVSDLINYEKISEDINNDYGAMTATNFDFTANDIGKAITLNSFLENERRIFYIDAVNNGKNISVRTEPGSKTIQYNHWYLARNLIDQLPNYYNGHEWDLCINGVYEGKFPVENNTIQLEDREYAGTICIGNNYSAKIKTLNLGFLDGTVNTQTVKKNISKAIFRLIDSYGGKFGVSLDNLQHIYDPKDMDIRQNKEPVLKSGDVEMRVTDVWSKEMLY